MEYRDIFAWSYKDLKGIPPKITQHIIPLISRTKPIQQKNRRLNPRMQLVVKAKLEQLLQACFILSIELTDWLSHIVLVEKKGGNKLKVCVDYRDLNACTLKDHFPLPLISTIVNEVTGKELYSFMDGYSGYNQMSIALEDWHKTTFTSPWGTFIHVVMPFGLCNALVAFQKVTTYAFSKLLHKSMVVFIDDFSTQTSQEKHLEMLRACFQRCKEVGISLNLDKVYLAVVRSILLGYVVFKKGKEPNLDKVKVIVNLQPPTMVKQIRKVLSHIGWYQELIENYSTCAAPLTNFTKKAIKFQWT
jgi:hypothetical protein